ncbi:MAG: choice-of-anchor L domain-containing protein [Candidatus Hydrogenedentota bacterium]
MKDEFIRILLILIIVTTPFSLLAGSIDSGVTAFQLANAMGIDSSIILLAELKVIGKDTSADHDGYGIWSDNILGFPYQSSNFAVLTCGNIGLIPGSNTLTGASYDQGIQDNKGMDGGGDDGVQLHIKLKVPDGMYTASYIFCFLSEEYPEYVGSTFNDFYFFEVGQTAITYQASKPSSSYNIVYDNTGKIISVNSDFFLRTDEPTGTQFDGRTQILANCFPVIPGDIIDIYFSVGDMGDAILMSGVFIDDFRFYETKISKPHTVDLVTKTLLGLESATVSVINYPNPFIYSGSNGVTINLNEDICQRIPGKGISRIDIFDARGRKVITLNINDKTSIVWDGKDSDGQVIASGVYYYLVYTVDGRKGKGKLTFIK